MKISVLGCSGAKSVGKSPTTFLIDECLLIDSGSVVSKLESSFILEKLKYLLLTHSHFDHILELPFLLELIIQKGNNPFQIFASGDSIKSLYSNIFNYECWPNLFEIAEKQQNDIKLTKYVNLETFNAGEYEITPVPVNHTVTTHGFIVEHGGVSLAFTGDTYSTDLFWEYCNKIQNLKAVIVDLSFPSSMKKTAEVTKHMNTDVLIQELNKLNSTDLPILISHMKPDHSENIKAEIESNLSGRDFTFLEDGMVLDI